MIAQDGKLLTFNSAAPVGGVLLVLVLMGAALAGLGQQRGRLTGATPRDYIPWVPERMPLKEVRLVYHVIQDRAGAGNIPANQAGYDFLLKMIHWTKKPYRTVRPSRVPTGSPYIPDSRITFTALRSAIYFHRDSLYDFSNETLGFRTRRLNKLYRKYVTTNDTAPYPRKEALHVFLVPGARKVGHGIASGIGDGRWVAVINTNRFFQEGAYWWAAKVLRHELGHAMGLLHACGGPPPHPANDGCPDTHPKDAPNPCDTIGPRSNNLMDYNEQQMHITAQQMGRMHFYLAGERGTIHRTLYQRYWQRYHPERPTRLTDTVALKGLRRYPGDVIVGRHALLRVHDSITLPPGAELRIERGGRLELMNGAAIACGKPGGRWRGIVYSGHPQQARQRRAIVIGAASRVHDARMPYRCRRGSSYTAYSPTLRR